MNLGIDAANTIDSGPTQVAADLSGRTLGAYIIESRLGSGGMGTVYRARDAEGRAVAVKVLFPELALVPEVMARFMREGEALRALDHPGIVRGIASGAQDGLTYLAMELVEGESLEARLLRGIDAAECAALVVAIADALGAAHARGIVHRDLKPANVLIARDGQVKLVDFGVARFDVADGTLTHTDAVLGTFNYMAPEQRLRSRDVDQRADLFALGVIFYRGLTGALPIGAYERPSAVNRRAPTDYDAIVAKLLASDPQKRFADASSLMRAVNGVPRRRRLRRLSTAVAVMSAVAASAVLWWSEARVAPPVVAAGSGTVIEQAVSKDTPVVPSLAPRDEPQNQQADALPPQYDGGEMDADLGSKGQKEDIGRQKLEQVAKTRGSKQMAEPLPTQNALPKSHPKVKDVPSLKK